MQIGPSVLRSEYDGYVDAQFTPDKPCRLVRRAFRFNGTRSCAFSTEMSGIRHGRRSALRPAQSVRKMDMLSALFTTQERGLINLFELDWSNCHASHISSFCRFAQHLVISRPAVGLHLVLIAIAPSKHIITSISWIHYQDIHTFTNSRWKKKELFTISLVPYDTLSLCIFTRPSPSSTHQIQNRIWRYNTR